MYWFDKFYYLEHNCSVPPEPHPVDKFFPGEKIFARLHRKIRKLCVISAVNVGARLVYPSRMAINQEILRHLLKAPYMIHPYSIFRKFWEDLMIIVYFCAIFLIPFDGTFINGPARYEISIYRIIVQLLSFICVFDIFLNFLTGYFNPVTRHVEMRFMKVALKYLKFFFFIDTLSTIPFLCIDYIFKEKINNDKLGDCVCHSEWSISCGWELILLMGCLKSFRFTTLLLYMDHHIARIIRKYFYTFNILKMFLVAFYCIFCMTLLNYILFKAFIASNELGRGITRTFLSKEVTIEEFRSFSPFFRFYFVYYRITYAFLLYSYKIDAYMDSEDIVITTIINTLGNLLRAYLLGQLFMTLKSANSLKFLQEQVQLKKFMKHVQLSNSVQSRILDYRNFCVKGVYFKENEISSIIGRKLRNDITLNSCESFIRSVHFFTNLPIYLVMRIVNYLYLEFFMVNDAIVMPANKDAIRNTTMYFIKTGTVAVYDDNNVEIAHLSDGDYFGEMSLILDDKTPYSKVIALEFCTLYTLNRSNLLRALKPYPEILRKIIETLKRRKTKMEELAELRETQKSEIIESTRKTQQDNV